MGMFDNIEYRGRQYQTKDTPLQTLDNYKIELIYQGGMMKIARRKNNVCV